MNGGWCTPDCNWCAVFFKLNCSGVGNVAAVAALAATLFRP